MSYIDRLIEDCKAAKKATPIKEFELQNLSELEDIQQAIYIIEDLSGDIKKTSSAFLEYKKKKERKCAKLNSPSKTMYVGSSTTGVKKRIKQHQGDGHKDTYALHLKYWFEGNYKVTVKQYNQKKSFANS